MGFFDVFSFDGAQKFADLAKKNEAHRQGKINVGLDQIDAVFGGGTAPFYTVATGAYNPSGSYARQNSKTGAFAPYYPPKAAAYGVPTATTTQDLDAFRRSNAPPPPLTGLERLFGTKESRQDHRRRSEFRKGSLYTVREGNFKGFTPKFFDDRYQAYIDYALPQLGRQFDQANKSVIYGLANRGLGKSGAANTARSNLQYTTGQSKQQIADSGIMQKQQLQKDIEAAKQSAIAQLYTTADPARATQSALTSASQFQGPSVFAPIGNMFGNLLNQYYTNQLLSSYQPRSFVSTPGNDFSNMANALPNVVNQGK